MYRLFRKFFDSIQSKRVFRFIKSRRFGFMRRAPKIECYTVQDQFGHRTPHRGTVIDRDLHYVTLKELNGDTVTIPIEDIVERSVE